MSWSGSESETVSGEGGGELGGVEGGLVYIGILAASVSCQRRIAAEER